jgi:hypothetical protein
LERQTHTDTDTGLVVNDLVPQSRINLGHQREHPRSLAGFTRALSSSMTRRASSSTSWRWSLCTSLLPAVLATTLRRLKFLARLVVHHWHTRHPTTTAFTDGHRAPTRHELLASLHAGRFVRCATRRPAAARTHTRRRPAVTSGLPPPSPPPSKPLPHGAPPSRPMSLKPQQATIDAP